MGKLSKLPRAEQWADQICAQLGKTVESNINVGRLLLEAKEDLVHGEWLRMFDGGLLPFRKSWGEMFMAIAAKSFLVNSHDRGNLPSAVGTLYQLSKADPTKFKNALKDGLITPDMKRRDVKALLPSNGKAKHQQKDNETIHHELVQRALDTIQVKLDRFWDQYPSQRPTIQASISSWETYFAVKRQAEQ